MARASASPTAPTGTAKPTRQRAPWGSLGLRRYERYCAAFDHVLRCCEGGYYLEAVAVIDSLLSDRLGSRLMHLTQSEGDATRATGQLCNALLPKETHEPFQDVISRIGSWARRRNGALHEAAKVLHGGQPTVTFQDLLNSHAPVAKEGIALLQELDGIDTALRKRAKKTPATFPGAFNPAKRRIKPPADTERGG